MDTKTNSPTPTETDSQAFERATERGIEWTGITANMARGPVEAFRAGFMAARAEAQEQSAAQSARIAELTEALAALVEHAGRIPNQRTMTTEFMAAYSLARAALKDSK